MEKFIGKPVSFDQIDVTDGFWKEKQELFYKVTIKSVYDRFEETGRFEALKFNWKEGMPNKPHIFWESDVTKWIEGAAYFLQKKRDPELETKVDELVERMVNTQDENGYLNAYFTVVEPDARFTRRTDHELYCAGHLVEGAIAYAKATGKTAMLQVAEKYIDLIDRVFRIDHSAKFDTPGHEEIELALMKLYDYTKEERYKLLAEYFINTRGTSNRDETYSFTDQEHMQSHLPVRKQFTAEGHSVRALYLYSGMADLALRNKEEELFQVCKELFSNIVNKRMYITGGIGSTHRGESFTFDYDLPEYTAYNETCASIALAMFCRRMWLIEPNGIYADCAEKALYNTVLSGVSLSGDSFFYENPLAVDPDRNIFNDSRPQGLKEHLPIMERVKVFDCSCCPPNLLRVVGSIADYMYSTAEDVIFAHCFMDAAGTVWLQDKAISLVQKTKYPYEGRIEITTQTDGTYTLALRIPAWAKKADITINGEEISAPVKDGYAYCKRSWKTGDKVSLNLEMEIKVLEANPKVVDLCGRAAVTRGPLVYCAESADNNYELRDARISRSGEYTTIQDSICKAEIPVITTSASVRDGFDQLYRDKSATRHTVPLKLIPYFARANRGKTELCTWFLLED
ncbi:glycoside hydrolase family 127 protein [Anaerocolumna sedimenticola]|uniref:Glycoside hydrolase family 127 protein n=1 Tax=Anaerocolumna sedimenticola TaxID=2696063 RepID=A0A6P1TU60_9FIRM|nr:beta-L-arabinofuranosidase domain-containing protein [Anaerocolumna sedimenticola]QHQ63226.1 glycoside hydrolase family 127 protein [Anaerocolumna sedimenticola]